MVNSEQLNADVALLRRTKHIIEECLGKSSLSTGCIEVDFRLTLGRCWRVKLRNTLSRHAASETVKGQVQPATEEHSR